MTARKLCHFATYLAAFSAVIFAGFVFLFWTFNPGDWPIVGRWVFSASWFCGLVACLAAVNNVR